MAFHSTHHTPHCCCCGKPVAWAVDDAVAAHRSTDATPTAIGVPTIGTDPGASDPTPEPDGGTQLPPPVPNPVCQGCATAATTADGEPIEAPPTPDSPPAPPDTTPETGPNPVAVDGVTCWRIGTDERWHLARDAVGCDSAAEFLRRHTDDDGQPLRWFGTDHRGAPRQIRITPDTVADITTFCERFADGTAFRIETAAAADRLDTPVVDIQRLPAADRAVSEPPQVSVLTAESTPRRVSISLPAIEAVSVAPQPTVQPPAPAAPSQQLDRYGQLAAVAPGVVDSAGLTAVLETGEPQARATAVRIFESVLAATATPGLTAIPALVECLSDGRLSRLYALRSLGHIAELYPDIIAEQIDPVIDSVTAESRLVAAAATRLLLYVAEHDPTAVVDAVPAFGALLAPTPTRARRQALATIGLLANPHPDAVRPLVPQLCSLLETDDVAYRISSTAALGRVTAVYPDAATPAVPTLVAQLTASNPELRANAVGVLGDIATEYPTDIAPYADELADLLADDDPTVRSNTAGAFARIAAVKPHHVEPFTDALIALLDDEWTRSRVHACWALGRCEASAAAEPLAESRHTDPEAAVRQRAAWALKQLS